jgi:hypothetical protein
MQLAVSASTPVRLGNAATSVRLESANDLDLATQILRGTPARYNLVIKGLVTDREPGKGFLVFLNAAPDVKASRDDPGYVGTINFFGVPNIAPERSSRVVSFDATATLSRLARAGRLQTPLTVTFVPSGEIDSESHPAIGLVILDAS